jgi:hypothetical protein
LVVKDSQPQAECVNLRDAGNGRALSGQRPITERAALQVKFLETSRPVTALNFYIGLATHIIPPLSRAGLIKPLGRPHRYCVKHYSHDVLAQQLSFRFIFQSFNGKHEPDDFCNFRPAWSVQAVAITRVVMLAIIRREFVSVR